MAAAVGLALQLAALPAAAAADLDAYVIRIYRGHPASPSALPRQGNAGIYLGQGLILTAAHVAGSPTDSTPLGIAIGDRLVPARFVKAGRFEETDASLLSVDEDDLPRELRDLPVLDLCSGRLAPGRAVSVAGFGRVDRSVIISHRDMPSGVPAKFDSLIRDVYTTGESGSGVFDPVLGCLAGIISRRIEILPEKGSAQSPIGLGKYFVPADEISAFLGASSPPRAHPRGK